MSVRHVQLILLTEGWKEEKHLSITSTAVVREAMRLDGQAKRSGGARAQTPGTLLGLL